MNRRVHSETGLPYLTRFVLVLDGDVARDQAGRTRSFSTRAAAKAERTRLGREDATCLCVPIQEVL